MEKKWTREQNEVISHRNGNLLVSAGAGAGKTAVLVERILGRILEECNPIGIDEFLIVTFTRAAAAEMKERIGKVLEEKLEKEMAENPDSQPARRLMKQYALLPEAEISTIDSFCKTVVMEHFQKTDLDPSFRIADEVELKVLKAEFLEEFLEEKYAEGRADFLRLSEYFDRGKRDDKLGELILEICNISESFPSREGWFREEIHRLEEEPFSEERMETLLELIQMKILSVKSANEKAIELSASQGGPLQYLEALYSDGELIRSILTSRKIEDVFSIFEGLGFATLSRKKPRDASGKELAVNEEIKEKVKAKREYYKNILTKKLKEKYFYDEVEEVKKDYQVTRDILIHLLRLGREFGERFSGVKRKKNLVDFSDLSHFALDILIDEKGEPTEIAKEYRDRFAEIMIDEYQDSNRIQDILLSAISRERIGEPNLFMVGDVKQSIYGFRQAEPKIFLEKYHSYGDSGKKRKISLFQNFRSGKEVIDTVNIVFKKTMLKEIGGLEYDDKAALIVGREDKKEKREENRTEILLFDSAIEEEGKKLNEKEKEAYMIAKRMKELRKEGREFRDMVILLRSMSGWSEVFKEVMNAEGIPAISETQSGFFGAWEVQVALAFLSVLDNPIQDIPLVSVLLSPIGNFTEEELACLRIEADSEEGMWEALKKSKSEKAVSFLRLILEKRRECIYTPVHEMLINFYEETGFYEYVSGMKSGEVRAANLDMLVVKAKEFESTSLFGINHFVRYIEKLRKYKQDFGEAEAANSMNAVRIMSIHKSKGLEFPVVFVSGLTKGFNETDAKKSVVFHKNIGLATDYFNIETREESRSFFKSYVSERIKLDNLSEEIRILYVALTRAKEKLILTGVLKEAGEKLEKIREMWENVSGGELFSLVSDSGSLFDIAIPPLLVSEGDSIKKPKIYSLKDIYLAEGEEVMSRDSLVEQLESRIDTEFTTDVEREAFRKIEKELDFCYPYSEAVDLKPSMSVSELKRLHLSEEEIEVLSFKEKQEGKKVLEDFEAYVPEFLKEDKGEDGILSGAKKGSLIHKFLSKMDFSKDYTKEEIEKALEEMSFTDSVQKSDVKAIYDFTKSELASRMKRASLQGELFLEVPFTLGIKKKIHDAEEMIVVQGIIDAWFMEGGEPVLLDYKTDRVKKEDGEAVLISRYRTQLEYYQDAIERATGKKVKESLIYSFALGKSILLK